MKRFLFILFLAFISVVPLFADESDSRSDFTFGFTYTYSSILPHKRSFDTNNAVVTKEYKSNLSNIGLIISEEYYLKKIIGVSGFSILSFSTDYNQYIDGVKTSAAEIFGLNGVAGIGLSIGLPLSHTWMIDFKPGVDASIYFSITSGDDYFEIFEGIGAYFDIDIKARKDIFIYKFGVITSYNSGIFGTVDSTTDTIPIAKNLSFTPYLTIGFDFD